jgi:hypothetical protein
MFSRRKPKLWDVPLAWRRLDISTYQTHIEPGTYRQLPIDLPASEWSQ